MEPYDLEDDYSFPVDDELMARLEQSRSRAAFLAAPPPPVRLPAAPSTPLVTPGGLSPSPADALTGTAKATGTALTPGGPVAPPADDAFGSTYQAKKYGPLPETFAPGPTVKPPLVAPTAVPAPSTPTASGLVGSTGSPAASPVQVIISGLPLPVSIVGAAGPLPPGSPAPTGATAATPPPAPTGATAATPPPAPTAPGAPVPVLSPKNEAWWQIQVDAAKKNVQEGPADLVPREAPQPSLLDQIAKLTGQIPGLGGVSSAAGNLSKLTGLGSSAPAAATAGTGAEAAAGAGGAEAAAGIAGGAGLAAAGPIGAGLALLDSGAKLVAGAFNTVTENVTKFGNDLSKAAGNDNLGALTGEADRVAEAFGKIPITGQIAEAAIKSVTGTIRAFDQVVGSFVQRGRELADYSGALSRAQAVAEVRDIRADVREAQNLGPAIADLTDAQSRASHEFRELVEPIKKVVVEFLTGVLEYVIDLLRTVKADIAAVKEFFNIQLELFNDVFGNGKVKDIPRLLLDTPERIAQAVKAALRDEDKDDADLVMEQLRQLNNQAGMANLNAPQPDPLAGAGRFGLFGPAFGG